MRRWFLRLIAVTQNNEQKQRTRPGNTGETRDAGYAGGTKCCVSQPPHEILLTDVSSQLQRHGAHGMKVFIVEQHRKEHTGC